MTRYTLEIYDDIVSTINKIQNLNDSGVELDIPKGSILFENVLNLKLIKHYADRFGVTVHFLTEDPAGNNLIDMIEEGTGRFSPPAETNEFNLGETHQKEESTKKWLKGTPFKLKLPKIQIVPIILAIILIVGYHLAKTQRTATVKLTINSQPLTRSLAIKVMAGKPTDPSAKILAGTTIQNTIDLTKETPTTGEALEGKKAEGFVYIYNKTTSEKTLKKGHTLVFDDKDVEYKFTIDKEVTIPERTEDLITAEITPGKAEVAVTAGAVGAAYNIEKDETLSVDDYKKADLSATTKDDFTGGKSEVKKVVADADLKKLGTDIDAETVQQSAGALKAKTASSQALITQSAKTTVIKDNYNHKVGDAADSVSDIRTVQIEGLTYMKSELDRLLDTLVKDLVPAGFVLSSKDRQVAVDVLGNASNSVVSPTQADLQVTLKAFVVPDITEESLKKNLSGKKATDAEKYLKEIQNVKNYDFKLNKGFIPIFNTVPTDASKINVEIVRE